MLGLQRALLAHFALVGRCDEVGVGKVMITPGIREVRKVEVRVPVI